MSLIWLASAGCSGPGPRMFPPAPSRVSDRASGRSEWRFDLNGDGRADAAEYLDAADRLVAIGYDSDHDGEFEDIVELADVPSTEIRHLVMILDSVPIQIAEEVWTAGRFRGFHPPKSVLAPFPVMTDLSLSEFFDVSPSPGVESSYYNGKELVSGYDTYLNEGNTPWAPRTDYRMTTHDHPWAYLWPYGWFGHEMREMQRDFLTTDQPIYIAYFVGTSGAGANFGRNGHKVLLTQVDRLCQQLLFDTRGRVRITMFSDHGHNLIPSRRIPLADVITRMGYHVGERLELPSDVVVPEFGLITCAAIHAVSPKSVAQDLIGIEGIELTACMDGDDRILIHSIEGNAVIKHTDAGHSYHVQSGDPLHYVELLKAAESLGEPLGADTWFKLTCRHDYPDAPSRLWRAFHGLVVNTPQVLVSVADGYHCGEESMSTFVEMMAAHGSLRATSGLGFVMSMSGPLPEITRMSDLRQALMDIGVPLDLARTGSPKDRPQCNK